MSNAWGDAAARFLLDDRVCPRCERGPVSGDRCVFCGAALTGPEADRVRELSRSAAELLAERQRAIAGLPIAPVASASLPPPTGMPTDTTPPPGAAPGVVPSPTSVPAATAPVAGATAAAPAPVSAPARQVSVQSVLAIAGAGLISIAALVFAYLSPDITTLVRDLVVAVVMVLFLGGAWWLARRGIRFSAEAVGALGVVFLALTVASVVEKLPDAGRWAGAGAGALVASAALFGAAVAVRLRSWLWLALPGFVSVPVLFATAVERDALQAGRGWTFVAGWLAAGFVALVWHAVLDRVSRRFASPLAADHVTATVLRGLAVVAALIALARVDEWSATTRVLLTAAALAVIAVLAALGASRHVPGIASAVAGVAAVAAVAIIPAALELEPDDDHWLLALVPAAAAVGLVAAGMLPSRLGDALGMRRRAWRGGAIAVAVAAAFPAAFIGALQAGTMLSRMVLVGLVRQPPGPWEPVGSSSVVPEDLGIAATLGLLAAGAGAALFSRLPAASQVAAPDGGPATRSTIPLALALWATGLAAHTAATWAALPWAVQLAATVGGAILLGILLGAVPAMRRWSFALRAPLVALAHVLLLSGTLTAWTLEPLNVPGGAAAVVAILAVSAAVPPLLRAVYVGLADAMALVVLARGLWLAEVDDIVVLTITTTAAAAIAFVVTVVHRVPRSWWISILIVTLVPFLIGVASVIPDEHRSGWTALSTGAIFALALVLVHTRRNGLTGVIRAGAAALLVPSLAVVAVSLASELDVSGSPYALPVIGVIVACALAIGHVVRDSLVRAGRGERGAAAARIAIETSAGVTAVIAALLALFLPATGFATAMLVLLVVGIGAAAARVFGGRRYGWWVAAAAWTFALWCVWALAEVTVVEPYLMPPAVAAMVIGTVLAARGRDGGALATVGLSAAVLPTLVLLAVSGNGDGTSVPWRMLGLLAASVALLVVGALLGRRRDDRPRRLAPLRVPALAVAIGAAFGGAVQAVRLGLGADALTGWAVESTGTILAPRDHDALMLPVLVLSIGAAALAAAAGAAIVTGARAVRPDGRLATTRWLLAPALVALVAGPIATVGPGAAPTWTLWGLALALLGLVVLTAWRALLGRTMLPPVWFVFAVAWCTAVAGWSPRDLHVEWFSLPLGTALLAAGWIGWRVPGIAPDGVPLVAPTRSLSTWPAGYRGSWWLLSPGVVVTLLPSMIGTGTNPDTWRAILVMALAVAGVVVASIVRLSAPFILGLVVLVIENAIVLLTLAGRGQEISPIWIWISVGTLGVVLLALAVNAERHTAQNGAAGGLRMRDLR